MLSYKMHLYKNLEADTFKMLLNFYKDVFYKFNGMCSITRIMKQIYIGSKSKYTGEEIGETV